MAHKSGFSMLKVARESVVFVLKVASKSVVVIDNSDIFLILYLHESQK